MLSCPCVSAAHVCISVCEVLEKEHHSLKLANIWCCDLHRVGRVSSEFTTPVCVTAKGPCRSHKCTHTQTHALPFNVRRGETEDLSGKGRERD